MMALDKLSLGNFLKLLSSTPERQTSLIRSDARAVIRKREGGGDSGGGHFQIPFWSDCKDHVFERGHLPDLSTVRVALNERRKRLYPMLTAGFVKWWTVERRGINEDIRPIPEQIKGECGFLDLGGTIRVDNLLAFKIGGVRRRFVYPYFSETPLLNQRPATLGLAVIQSSLARFDPQIISILDIIRGEEFRLTPRLLTGNELDEVKLEYGRMLTSWRRFLAEYS